MLLLLPLLPLLPLLLLAHTGLQIHTHRVPIDTMHKYTQANSHVPLIQAYSHLVMAPRRYTGHCTLNSPPRQLVQIEKTKLSLDRELVYAMRRIGNEMTLMLGLEPFCV